jgi:hypothetical protein
VRRVAAVLLGVGAVAAAVSGLFSVPAAADAPAQFRLVEFWRAGGLLVFAGLFVVLALDVLGRSRVPGAVWWLVVGHKVSLTAVAAGLGEWGTAAVDAALVAVLLFAWSARGRERTLRTCPPPSTPPPAPSSSATPDART